MQDHILSLCLNDRFIIYRKWKHFNGEFRETPASILSLSQELSQFPVFVVLIWNGNMSLSSRSYKKRT